MQATVVDDIFEYLDSGDDKRENKKPVTLPWRPHQSAKKRVVYFTNESGEDGNKAPKKRSHLDVDSSLEDNKESEEEDGMEAASSTFFQTSTKMVYL